MATSIPVYRTGFTASMDGVSNAGVFIPMDAQTKIEDGASLGVKSYNITANTANSNENTVLSNIQVLEYEEVSRVDYNKLTPEDAFAAGNFVRVTTNWTGEEKYDSQRNRYNHSYVTLLDFGPNFDNSSKSVFVSSGDANENFMQMFETEGQEFDTSNGCGSFELGRNGYGCSYDYYTSGDYLNKKYTPKIVSPSNGYKCYYDETDGWYAKWNGPYT